MIIDLFIFYTVYSNIVRWIIIINIMLYITLNMDILCRVLLCVLCCLLSTLHFVAPLTVSPVTPCFSHHSLPLANFFLFCLSPNFHPLRLNDLFYHLLFILHRSDTFNPCHFPPFDPPFLALIPCPQSREPWICTCDAYILILPFLH